MHHSHIGQQHEAEIPVTVGIKRWVFPEGNLSEYNDVKDVKMFLETAFPKMEHVKRAVKASKSMNVLLRSQYHGTLYQN